MFQCAFIVCQIDFEWDEKMVKKNADYRCGIENKFKPPKAKDTANGDPANGQSRVINGRITSNIRYPWMAEVYHFRQTVDGLKRKLYSGGGSVISDKAIITAAHVLCTPLHLLKSDDPIRAACLEEPNGATSTGANEIPNQNRQENQIHYSIGNMTKFINTKDYTVFSFNDNIKAFLYKYEPEWWSEGTDLEKRTKGRHYKNGDAGLIIDTSGLGLNLKDRQAIPICLPSPKSFAKEFKITAVGRGDLYREWKAPFQTAGGKKITSCMTNEGVVKKREPEYAHLTETFLQCKNYDPDKRDSCIYVKDAEMYRGDNNKIDKYTSRLLSTDSKITFGDSSDNSGRKMKIEIPENDECEELYGATVKSVKKLTDEVGIKFIRDDGKGPSRIVVFENDVTDWVQEYQKWEKSPFMFSNVTYCYNLRRLETFGICETDDQTYNFGFCSPSCHIHDRDEIKRDSRYRKQWELKAIYYENPDLLDIFNGNYF